MTPDNLEQFLRRARPSVEANPEFAHRLRRALLSSRYYTESRSGRWWRAFRRFLPWSAGAMTIGFLGALMFTATPQSVPPAPNSTLVTVTDPATIEHLNQQGRIHYVQERSDGRRVYRIDLADGQAMEVWDAAPYVIQLTHK